MHGRNCVQDTLCNINKKSCLEQILHSARKKPHMRSSAQYKIKPHIEQIVDSVAKKFDANNRQ
jgi:hypothetical protein